jgi:O-antigen ligase
MGPRIPAWVPEGLLYAALAFGPLAFGAVEPWSRAGLELLALALALAAFLRGRPSGLSAAGDSLWLLPLAMAAYGALQLARPAAADGPVPQAPFTVFAHGTQGAVRLWLAYAAVVFAVPRVVASHEAARRFAAAVLLFGAGLAAQGLLQKGTTDKLYWVRPAGGSYPFGPYFNCDHAANLLMMCAAVGAGVLWSKRRRYPAVDGLPADQFARLGRWAALVGLTLVGVVACGARGAFLALPLAAAALLFFGSSFARGRRERVLLAGGAVAGAAAVLFLVFRYVGASADAGARVDDAVEARFVLYADAWRWWRHAPLLGWGLGSFEAAYPAWQDLSFRRLVTQLHSDWAQLGLEAGVPGLLGALLFLGTAAREGVRRWRQARSGEMRALVAGALAAVLAFSVHSLFEFSFQIPANAFWFFALSGFLVSAASWADKDAGRARPAPPPVWAGAAALAGGLVLALGSLRPVAAGWHASRRGPPPVRADALARALALDPDPRWLESQAQAYYLAGTSGAREDYDMTRKALARALAAAELRPFDADALFLAGAALRRLGRESDAAAYFERSRLVRFSPRPTPPPARPGR